jgi:iron-sulfur cluster repair protein YtfE (RIC family)
MHANGFSSFSFCCCKCSLNRALAQAKEQVEKMDADLRKVRAEHAEAIKVAQTSSKPDSRYEALQDQLRDKEVWKA